MSKYKGDSDMGCVVLLLIIGFAACFGLGIAALVTLLVSLLGIIEFTFINTLIVWVLIAILGLVTRS
jgi:hypothetical protein